MEALPALVDSVRAIQTKLVELRTIREEFSDMKAIINNQNYNLKVDDDLKVKKSYFRHVFNAKYNLSFGTPPTPTLPTFVQLV
ncbi:unnamed protein product [Pieris macdunnoughi]|uniref:Uncharacterized protein n=1 Tax=Pieris macdunnoughi TaxID=345717 RepID=A0A821UHF1_9NEOP|nr:unnamed protein product [Pieris macdunnoughi]